MEMLLILRSPATLRQELKPYCKTIVDAYRESYGELKGGRWIFRHGTPDLIDKANLELAHLWDTPSL
jgi:hypothetical protein